MSPIVLLLILFVVMMIPMFLMSGRQRKAQQKQQEMLAQIGIGDEVRTHSGFYGLIVEEFDDTVVLESENGAQLKWARAAIALRIEPDGTPAVESESDAERLGHARPDEPDADASWDQDTRGSSAAHADTFADGSERSDGAASAADRSDLR